MDRILFFIPSFWGEGSPPSAYSWWRYRWKVRKARKVGKVGIHSWYLKLEGDLASRNAILERKSKTVMQLFDFVLFQCILSTHVEKEQVCTEKKGLPPWTWSVTWLLSLYVILVVYLPVGCLVIKVELVWENPFREPTPQRLLPLRSHAQRLLINFAPRNTQLPPKVVKGKWTLTTQNLAEPIVRNISQHKLQAGAKDSYWVYIIELCCRKPFLWLLVVNHHFPQRWGLSLDAGCRALLIQVEPTRRLESPYLFLR